MYSLITNISKIYVCSIHFGIYKIAMSALNDGHPTSPAPSATCLSMLHIDVFLRKYAIGLGGIRNGWCCNTVSFQVILHIRTPTRISCSETSKGCILYQLCWFRAISTCSCESDCETAVRLLQSKKKDHSPLAYIISGAKDLILGVRTYCDKDSQVPKWC